MSKQYTIVDRSAWVELVENKEAIARTWSRETGRMVHDGYFAPSKIGLIWIAVAELVGDDIPKHFNFSIIE